MEERIRFVIRASSGHEGLCDLSEEFGVDRSTGRRWRDRYQLVGDVNDLREHSREPHHKPNKTPEWVEKRVIDLRKRYGWGARKLKVLLDNEGISLPSVTIGRILKRNGLIKEEDSTRPAVERFERSEPNELWQMDFKGDIRTEEMVCHPLSILDDHSRYAIGLYPLRNLKTEGVKRSLLSAFREHGVPKSMLMDRGTPWWNVNSVYGLTTLGVWLIEQDIKLIRGRVRHPQTQGKVERFHRTIKDALAHKGKAKSYKHLCRFLKDFREEYNQIRPHEALGMNPPVKKYKRSKKEFKEKVAPWSYPDTALIHTVDELGTISVKGKRFFISEALRKKQVALERLDESYVVSFRSMTIRQIHTNTGKSNQILLPNGQLYW